MNAHEARALFHDRVHTIAEIVREAEKTNRMLRQRLSDVEHECRERGRQLLDSNDRLRRTLALLVAERAELAEEREINTEYEVQLDADRRQIEELEAQLAEARAQILPLPDIEQPLAAKLDQLPALGVQQLLFPDEGKTAEVTP